METRCFVNGPAIGSARSSDTKAPFGVRNSVTTGRGQPRAVQILQRASPYHIVHTYRSCAVPLTRTNSALVAVRFGIRTADSHSTPSHTITSSAVLQSPHRICSRADKKRRSEYSTSGNRMRSQISYLRAVASRMMARSRVWCGSTKTPV